MSKELELWNFIAGRLRRGEQIMLLVVAESTGSSPGRAGYKMAVGVDGELIGSIGGGVMEVNLVERARKLLSSDQSDESGRAILVEQEHRKNSKHPSGMICSGKQSVILKEMTPDDIDTTERIIDSLTGDGGYLLIITDAVFSAGPDFCGTRKLMKDYEGPIQFEQHDRGEFTYSEELDRACKLLIVGGGHCALALSELMSKLGFRITIYDDRPSLNTLAKNDFADEITIIDGYDKIAEHIPDGDDVYVVVMTLGYASDAVVIRQLIDHELKYLGVLGSKAKMATLMKELRDEGFSSYKLGRIHTPIGIPINSRTPEEIAVSIAAEIISKKNAD